MSLALARQRALANRQAVEEGRDPRRGLRETDPTSAAVAAMPKLRHRPNHHRALHHRDLPDALNKIRTSEAAAATKGALELLALTATRPGEVRNDAATRGWTDESARHDRVANALNAHLRRINRRPAHD